MPDPSAVFRTFIDAVGLHGQAVASAAGLPATDWYALSVLDLEGRLTAGELAERTGLTTGAATRMIDRLVRAGRARRVADGSDRRRVLVERVADAAAQAEVDDLVGPARRAVGEVIDGYTDAERTLLLDFFERAAPAFREGTEHIRRRVGPRRRPAPARARTAALAPSVSGRPTDGSSVEDVVSQDRALARDETGAGHERRESLDQR